ncbi:MAG: hypothetical protein QOI19_1994, partial [Thermoleophilaceae bacterium]|nr:hypothetical protein [Thermoleophilaceae bacterium]
MPSEDADGSVLLGSGCDAPAFGSGCGLVASGVGVWFCCVWPLPLVVP